MLSCITITAIAALVAIRIISEIVRVLTRKPFVWVTNEGKCWAVVSGAGSGMGFEWARQLALKGYNLLLISMYENELLQAKEKISEEVKLTTKYNDIQIRTLAIDFSKQDIYGQVEQFLDVEKNDIFVLVNNVGTAVDLPNNFLSGDYVTRNQTLINVNLVAMTRMIELVLPSMVRKQRGLVINMASGSCNMPCPLLAVYTATKSYVWKLSECLATEYLDSNIHIRAFGPLFVSTNMTQNPTTHTFVLSPKDYVSKALASIKYHEYLDSQIYWAHWLQNLALQMIGWLLTPLALQRFQNWFMLRIKRTQDKHKWWHQHKPDQEFTQWEQLKYLFLSDQKSD